MFFIENYWIGILFCIITMICWGSWANMQKIAGTAWPFQCFYWDYTLGILLINILLALTLGSYGSLGRDFISDILQADLLNLLLAFISGVTFNLGNLLIITAIAISGISIAMPIAVSVGIVLGVFINYIASPIGNAFILFGGVIFIVAAIICNAKAYQAKQSHQSIIRKGIIIAILAGVVPGAFYYLLIRSMAVDFSVPEMGKITPYTACFIFALGSFMANFIFTILFMKKPPVGDSVNFQQYFNGNLIFHFYGVIGGIVVGIGTCFNLIASKVVTPAVSFGLGNGSTMIAALWGLLLWKEFTGTSEIAKRYLSYMFVFYIAGLTMIAFSKL